MQQSDILMTSNYVTMSIISHLVVRMMIRLFCVNLVAISWVVIKFSKGPSKAPFPSNSKEAQNTPGQNSVKYRSWYFCFFLRLQIHIFLRFPTFILSFLKNHKEIHLMLWLLLASFSSELACLWFATWGLEFYWARKASFFWTLCNKEREQLCLLSG